MNRIDSDFTLKGLGTALVTPFKDGEVDAADLTRQTADATT